MSRSEHGNARDKNDPGDVARKRRIKRLQLAARRGAVPEGPLAITVLDRAAFVQYPALEDLRPLIARLPHGLVQGLGGIDLRLTPLADQDPDAALDPLVGRLAQKLVNGVYAPPTLGTYREREARIELFAYVYDHIEPSLALYLRLQVLTTFVRQLARHHEAAARGRWREERANDWIRAYVVPYVEDAYPAEVAALARWLVEHGGVAMPLEALCHDEDGPILLASPFVGLCDAVMRGEPAIAAKLDFAFNLHFGYRFDLALAVVDDVLAREPEHVEALRWRAHVMEHLERYDEADGIAREILARDGIHTPSWWVLRASAIRRRDWTALREVATRMIELQAGSETLRAVHERFSHLYWRAWASLELGDVDAADRDRAALRSMASTLENAEALRDLEARASR